MEKIEVFWVTLIFPGKYIYIFFASENSLIIIIILMATLLLHFALHIIIAICNYVGLIYVHVKFCCRSSSRERW